MKKNIEKIGKALIVFALIIATWFLWQELSFAHTLNSHNEASREGKTVQALKGYVILGEKYPQKNDIVQYNAGVVAYQEQNYTQAKQFFDQAAEVCQQGIGTYCSQIFYNTGNTQYRLGEQMEEREERVKQWEKAIASYEMDLALDPEDHMAQENIDFIRQKMQEEQEQEAQEGDESQEGEEGTEGDEQDGEEGSNGESGEEEGASSESAGQDGEQEGQEEGEGEGEGGQASESGEGQQNAQGQNASQPLDQRTDAEVEAYMQQMQQNEQQMQEYFSHNPDAQNANDPNNSLSNDPLFQAFFGNRQDQNFNNQKDAVEKDW